MRNILTPAIIVKKRPHNETDSILTICSPILGKIQAIARGSRKISSHWSGHLEPMNLCQMQLYKSPTRFTITQCQVEKNFKNIYKSIGTLSVALLILEIFQKSTDGQEHSLELFDLLNATFHRLSGSDEPFLVLERFKLELLELNGALPSMTTCAFCHHRWNPLQEIWLDRHGHFSCGKCAEKGNEISRDTFLEDHGPYKRITFEVIKLVCYLLDKPAELVNKQRFASVKHHLEKNQIKNIKIRPLQGHQKQQLQLITHTFLQHFINREIIGEKIHEKMTAV